MKVREFSENFEMELFILSKPLQILNILNYTNNFKSTSNATIFIKRKSFYKSEIIFKRLNEQFSNGLRFILIDSYFDVLRFSFSWKRITRLYIDSDVGLKLRFLISVINADQTCIIEEGLGLYIKVKYNRLIKTRIGSFYKTKKIIAYHPENLDHTLKHKAIRIDQSLQDYIESNFTLLTQLFENKEFDRRIEISKDFAVYLTNWYFDPSKLDKYNHTNIVVRKHPGLKNNLSESIVCLDKYLVGELDILWISKRFKDQTILVLHHNSSLVHYIDKPNLKFVKIE